MKSPKHQKLARKKQRKLKHKLRTEDAGALQAASAKVASPPGKSKKKAGIRARSEGNLPGKGSDADHVVDFFAKAKSLLDLAAAAMARGQEDEAVATLREAAQACPGCVQARVALAKALRRQAASQAQLDEVESELRAALDAAGGSGVGGGGDDDLESASALEALQLLAFHLCQEGRDAEAEPALRALRKTYRLSREVLCYEQPRAPPQKDRGGSTKHVRILDGALPPDMFAMMQSAFAPSAPFWREHAYHDPATGYFSYVHALGGGAPRSGLDQVIRHIHALVCRKQPQAEQACFAEWWAHCRPHSSGHQLHFDSDNEGQGTVRNPILSSVIYLHEDESVGGPTLMTNQRLGARLADRGWLVFPRANRLVSFDGAVLHGVVPGRSYAPPPPPPHESGGSGGSGSGGSGGGGNAAGGAAGARRVTFMVAFWRAIRTRPSPDGRPGPSQPFPYKAAAAAAGRTWQRPLLPVREGWGEDAAAAAAAAAPRVVLPFPLRRVWEAVGEEMTPVEALSGPPHYNLCFQGF